MSVQCQATVCKQWRGQAVGEEDHSHVPNHNPVLNLSPGRSLSLDPNHSPVEEEATNAVCRRTKERGVRGRCESTTISRDSNVASLSTTADVEEMRINLTPQPNVQGNVHRVDKHDHDHNRAHNPSLAHNPNQDHSHNPVHSQVSIIFVCN